MDIIFSLKLTEIQMILYPLLKELVEQKRNNTFSQLLQDFSYMVWNVGGRQCHELISDNFI